MSNFNRICLVCYLSVVALLQTISIFYLIGWIEFDKLTRFAFPCKKNYYFSRFSFEKDRYKIDGYCPEGVANRMQCIDPERGLNKFYLSSRKLDSISFKYLNRLTPNKVYYTNNMDEFVKLGSIKHILDNTMFKVKSVTFRPQFDSDNFLRYVYVITSYHPTKSCDRLSIDILEEM